MTTVVVDTHAIIWFLGNDRRLSAAAGELLDRATRILLPAFVLSK